MPVLEHTTHRVSALWSNVQQRGFLVIFRCTRSDHLQQAKIARLAATNGRGKQACPLLEALPLEIRLQIYEELLCSHERIAISPSRRQQSIETERCSYCGYPHLQVTPPWRPKVTVLRTCKQINNEATPILYRKNEFVIGCKCPLPSPSHGRNAYNSCHLEKDPCSRRLLRSLTIPAGHSTVTRQSLTAAAVLLNKPFHARQFFPWFLRRSTLRELRSITFRVGCHCTNWVACEQREWTTDGRILARAVFPHCVFGGLLPSPVRAREVHAMIRRQILSDTRTYYNPCITCRYDYRYVF